MEFKGTKGQWYSVEYAGNYILQAGENYGDDNILDAENVDIEAKYNALLISKAPEMLEMLISLSKTFEDIWFNHDGEENVLFDKIDAEKLDTLIKSATEI